MIFVTALYSIALVSKNKKIWLLKWGASIPFSYFVLQYFWNTHYSIRALNWVFPDYGRDTAGGRFAGSALFMIFSVMCLICGIITFFIKIKNYDKFRKIQFIVTLSSAVLIVCTVLILEKQFPSYGYIISHT